MPSVDDGRMPDVVRRASTAEFIGRAELLDFFDRELATAGSTGGDVVLVAGEAGVGKSRLIDAWVQRATAAHARVAVGQCVEHGEQSMPLAAISDLMRDVTGHLTSNEQDEFLTAVAGEPFLLLLNAFPPTGGAGATEAATVARLSDGLLLGLRILSRRSTVVAVIEDLHWADESTRRVLAYLAPRLGNSAILLIVSYRSDDLDRSHPLRPLLVSLERAVRPERIELAPFTLEELTELVATITGQAPEPSEVLSLHRRSGGNGFFAGELLAAEDAPFQPPMFLRDAVLLRTQSLNATQMTLLRTAAIAGPVINVGSPDAGRRAAEGLRLARACGSLQAEAHARITLASIRCRKGDSGGLNELREALAFALNSRLSVESCRAYDELAANLAGYAEYNDVVDMASEALDFCSAAGLRRTFGVMIESTLISSLQHLGRWADAEQRVHSLRQEFGHLRLEHFTLAGSWGRILVRQNRLDGVQAMTADAFTRMHDHTHVLGPTTTTAVELAAAEKRTDDIPDLVDSVLDRILPSHPNDAAELLASALGALADRVAEPETNVIWHRKGQEWFRRVESEIKNPRARTTTDLDARLALAKAELDRLNGRSDSEEWDTLITAFDGLDAPYERAYTQLRSADALLVARSGRSPDARTHARTLLHKARGTAMALSATLLEEKIEVLARRAHIKLDQPETADSSNDAEGPDGNLGLTSRELEVLRLIADGYTNGQIGQALFISRKTASVHVSNILRKLGVSSRLQAANLILRDSHT